MSSCYVCREPERMAKFLADGYVRGDSRTPQFGELVIGIWASEDNPQRIGKYVETKVRVGKLNRGEWYRLTDGHGKFWEYESNQTVIAPSEPE